MSPIRVRKSEIEERDVPRLRGKYPDELQSFTDKQIGACFADFLLSGDQRKGDECFIDEWLHLIELFPQ
jgi:hypothetical protein